MDSGGAGLHRGGNGLSVAYEFLAEGQIAIHDERWLTYPWGVNGGEPGMRSTKKLIRQDGSEEWLPAKCEGVDVKEGDTLYFNTWGGGGWGDPFAREPALVEHDYLRGLVSASGANRYGVVLDEKGKIDQDATDRLRSKMRQDRGDVELFNFGGTIDEIKARSMEETYLEPPVSP